MHNDAFVKVRGARQNNLAGFDLEIPQHKFVVFTGVSGSGKSSIAFDTIYAEAQKRYFESIAPYARRFLDQLPAPRVNEILNLPPAVAFKQNHAQKSARSTVGTITTLSNSLRMLFSRAGDYPEHIRERLDSDYFSSNTAQGACKTCHGIGVSHTVSQASLVKNPELSISEGAIAAWPGAWQGKNYRDILKVLGYDIYRPFKDLSEKDREWILFTEEKPVVTVFAEREAHRIQRPYQGTYMSAASYVKHTYATTESATLRKRVSQFMDFENCKSCNGKRLCNEALSVRFSSYDIFELSQMPLSDLSPVFDSYLRNTKKKKKAGLNAAEKDELEKEEIARALIAELQDRIGLLCEMGLEYLAINRTSSTLSAGELQRLRLANQLRSGLYGVVYVLDEPSAGLHPQDKESLLQMLKKLIESGNSLFVVEHDLDIIRQADWLVDIGPGAGEQGGMLLYSGPLPGLASCKNSLTKNYLFKKSRIKEAEKRETENRETENTEAEGSTRTAKEGKQKKTAKERTQSAWLELSGINKHNLSNLSVAIPLGCITAITGVSGSGKSTLLQVFYEELANLLGPEDRTERNKGDEYGDESEDGNDSFDRLPQAHTKVEINGAEKIKRLLFVDQKPIGRTPRSNLATYTGLFDGIRQLFASTAEARARAYKPGRFSFNVAGGRCDHCEGEGFQSVELLFLPSLFVPCQYCKGSRYNSQTLEIKYKGINIAEVLDLNVARALEFFAGSPALVRCLSTLKNIGLDYLKLGQGAPDLSGGEAQRIKLATELQRIQHGNTFYILDEPTCGLHPYDVEKLMIQLNALRDAGNTIVLVEHDMELVAACDWVIDLGPGAGSKGGQVIASASPQELLKSRKSITASYLKQAVLDRND